MNPANALEQPEDLVCVLAALQRKKTNPILVMSCAGILGLIAYSVI